MYKLIGLCTMVNRNKYNDLVYVTCFIFTLIYIIYAQSQLQHNIQQNTSTKATLSAIYR